MQFTFIFTDNPSKLWREQKELLSEMGIPVGENPADPDTLKQLEKLHELEDEMGEVYMEGNQQLKSVTRRWQPLHVFIISLAASTSGATYLVTMVSVR